ncbi:MAG TPA: phosphatase PAP2 family protein [Polyangiaceae bacterium]|nr:phosphatase PAP2 family protein [Polyangiaceae bacterium]
MPSGALSDEPTRTLGWAESTLRSLAVQDYLVFAYALMLNLAVAAAPPGPVHERCALRVGGLMLLITLTLVSVRGRLLPGAFLPALIYRVGVYGTVQISYFFFRELLPLVNPRSLDHGLHALGLGLFGAEPALSFDAWVNSTTTEWFAFFYFGYFFVLATHVLPILFLGKDKRLLNEFTFGLLFMFCVGHTLYTVVPGYGPFRAIAGEFRHRLPDGLWLNVVMETVAEGGAQKDIFPSLHTCAPTFIALYSFRHRALPPYRYTWPVVFFFAANIILATMFLRWHWVVDVVVGLALAVTSLVVSVKVTDFELARRAREALMPVWPAFTSRAR